MKAHYSKVRVGLVIVSFGAVFILFAARLVAVQVISGPEYRAKAQRQYLQSIELPAVRGEIYDTRGRKIVINGCFKSLFAYPLNQKDVSASYAQLGRILKMSKRALAKKFNLKPKKFRWIKRGLTPKEFARFDSAKKGCGLFVQEEPTRCYPFANVGRAVLGFVDLDNQGKSGVEMVMNEYLTGISGRSVIQRNGMGKEFRIQEIPIKKSLPGKSVVLTVDWDKQQIVEEELAKAVEKHNAKGGMAVFVDPHSGAILAAADYSASDKPNTKPMKLEAVSSTFEPGSIFKLVTAAAALESGLIQPSDSFYAEQGRWRLGRNTLRDDHKYDSLSFRTGYELSSNIVMGKIANKVGGDKILAMAKKMGFGRKTRCGLNGESNGFVARPPRWSKFVTSTFAIGHGLSVTPLQMAQAFATVASGGYLYQPFIVKGCINNYGQVVEQHESRPVKVLDDSTVAVLKSFMRGVVTRGTGDLLVDAPIAIAGKTGTAEKPNLESGGYYKNKFIASFAGYFPADSPLVVGIVIIDEPEPIHYGGHTSGPAFKNIAIKFAALDNYINVPPEVGSTLDNLDEYADAVSCKDVIRMPDLIGSSRTKAKKKLSEVGLGFVFEGTGHEIISTRPCAGSLVASGEGVVCYAPIAGALEKIMPDVGGLTIRETIALLYSYGIKADFKGKGRVVRQSPKAGELVEKNEKVKIVFKRS
ncbi:MAG: PASTA domain-containing protein [candidate division Zixibacteria bacterium]|nr:PASTA domain-containing protein [candidate division Zixibacteria bacterium]